MLASSPYIGGMAAILLLPPMLSLWLRHLALQPDTNDRALKWLISARHMRVLTLTAVPAWWCICGALSKSNANRISVLTLPAWVLLVAPLTTSILLARILVYWSDAKVFARGWTSYDILRLAWWRTLSSTVPLLLLAIGADALSDRSAFGLLGMCCAGVIVLLATARLRTAEGVNFRAVKSGELYKRARVMSKRMGVHLRRVCVVPFGRGRLTNAYNRWDEIAITDDYGHWLHGPQLDFVIGHELAHAKQKHGVKMLLVMTGVFAALAALAFAVPHMSTGWRVMFNFGVILLPVAVFDAISRHFEYAADRASVALTGAAEAAIRALMNMYRHAEVPAETSGIEELFSTHPGLWRRVNAIAHTAEISTEQLSTLRAEFSATTKHS